MNLNFSLTTDKQRELYETLLFAHLYGSFYDQPAEQLAVIRKLIRDNDPLFVARLAVYFREELHLRTLSFVLTAELAGVCKDKALVGRLAARVIQQASEIPAWLDHYARVGNSRKTVQAPSFLRKSLSAHFNRMDTYRFVRMTKVQQVRLRYALSIVRPKAAGKAQQALFRRILQDKLPARNAWQSEYEALLQQHYDSRELRQAALREKWKEGISTFRMGYRILVEKLPDVLAAGVSGKVLKLAAEYLGNAVAVTGSRLSPQQFLEAYRRLQRMEKGGAGFLQEALEQAIRHSVENLAGVDAHGRVVIAMDISPSMRRPVKEGSLVERYDIAPLLAMLLAGKGASVSTGIIGNTWKHTTLSAYNLFGQLDQLRRREGEAGYAIHAHLVIGDLLRKGEVVDKVMVFTDCTLWNHRWFNQPAGADMGRLWRQYREIAPQAKLYLFDLAGYGKKPLECLEDGVYLMAGWNERIFEVIKALDEGEMGMDAVEKIVL
ncbi:MAG TPA: hypothetical protein VHD83_20520 [Puia sp.]|nr:hypothetical protein [Puia sp.]